MKFTVMIYESESDFAARTDPQRKDAYWGAYRAYTKALADAGVMAGGAGLQPPHAATTSARRTALIEFVIVASARLSELSR